MEASDATANLPSLNRDFHDGFMPSGYPFHPAQEETQQRQRIFEPLYLRRTVVRHLIEVARRLNNQVRADEFEQHLEYLYENYKFLLFVLAKLVVDHFDRVLVMILLTFTWLCTRAVFPRTVLKYGTVVEFRQSEDNELTLILVVIVLGCFSLVEGVCPEEGFGRALFFSPPPIDSLFDLIWLSAVASVLINVIVILGKCMALHWQGPRKGKALTVVHSLGGLYKSLVVCQFFLSYLMSGAWSAGIVLGSALVFMEQAEVQKRASNFAWSCRMLVLG